MRTTLLNFRDQFNAGSIQGSIFTLVMATFGSGILILPYSMMASGLAWGSIQLIFCAWLGYYSLLTVVKCAIKEKVCSYQELAYLTYGGWFRLLMNAVLFLGNLGTVLMYLKLMSTLTLNFIISTFCAPSTPCVSYWNSTDKPQHLILIVIALLLLPLSLTKRLRKLRYLCLLSFFFVVFLCFIVMLQLIFFHPTPQQPTPKLGWFRLEGFSDTFPTAVFAFMSHPNLLDVFGELRNPRLRRMKKVISVTMILVFICCFMVGIFGYINFAHSPDLFQSNPVGGVILYAYIYDANGKYTGASVPISMCLIMMAFALLVTTPINVVPAKDAIKDLFFPRRCDIFGEPIDSGESKMTNFFLVTITIAMAAGIALAPWTNVQSVMNVIGSSFYTMICFIFPAIFYLRLHRLSRMDHTKVINWIILICMSGFAVWMTYENTTTLADSDSSDAIEYNS